VNAICFEELYTPVHVWQMTVKCMIGLLGYAVIKWFNFYLFLLSKNISPQKCEIWGHSFFGADLSPRTSGSSLPATDWVTAPTRSRSRTTIWPIYDVQGLASDNVTVTDNWAFNCRKSDKHNEKLSFKGHWQWRRKKLNTSISINVIYNA